MESEGNMFNPILKENVQERKHPGSCAFAEPELVSYRKPKHIVQKVANGHKIPNNSHNYHDETSHVTFNWSAFNGDNSMSHICVMKSTSHVPSDACMRYDSL